MKKNLLFILASFAILVASFSVSAQIPNGGFEDWEAITNQYTRPINWYTNNLSLVGNHVVLPAPVAHSGDSAAMVISVYNSSYLTTINGNLYDNFAFNQRPIALKGFFEARVRSGDSLRIIVVIKNGGTAIGTDSLYITSDQIGYAPFTATINYTSGMAADNVELFLQAGADVINIGDNIHREGDTLMVDDLAFDLGTGVMDLMATSQLSVYPNPAQDKLFVTSNNAENSLLTIYNGIGVQVYQSTMARLKSEINLKGFASGIYFVKLSDGVNESVRKLMIEAD